VIIGNDVWIGFEAVVLSGVTIGNGAVVAARAMVTKNVEPYAIVAGNPARRVRFRFSPEIVAQLEAIAWWDWPDDHVARAVPLLQSGDVTAFINQFKQGAG
jgi:carbonic anhydrase/acetyltransferase-like protein (isoleucine patch superfamily)